MPVTAIMFAPVFFFQIIRAIFPSLPDVFVPKSVFHHREGLFPPSKVLCLIPAPPATMPTKMPALPVARALSSVPFFLSIFLALSFDTREQTAAMPPLTAPPRRVR